jgi:predicted nucleic acid-binding protein
MDASHLAYARAASADCFVTVDKKMLNKHIPGIAVINTIDCISRCQNREK